MKNIKLFTYVAAIAIALVSCEEKGDILIDNQNVGGLISPVNKAITYVIGNGDTFAYNEILNVNQSGPLQVTKIYIYKSFVNKKGTIDEADDITSNEVLFRTYDVPTNSQNVNISFSVNYTQLISGLTVSGLPISSVDTNLFIGDAFTLRYEQLRSDGKTVESSRASNAITKLSIGTRLAGKYKTIEAVYYRIGLLNTTTTSWPAEIVVESVDATNYKIVERFGFFPPTLTDKNNIRFIVNGNNITYSPSQVTGNDQPFITCGSSPSNFNAEVNCGTSNKVVFDNVNQKDRLYMTFGYLSPSGPRVFYQVLEKIK